MNIKDRVVNKLQRLHHALLARPKLLAGVLLGGMIVLVYFRWLNFSIFTYGDWNYKFLETLRESAMPFSWVGDIGFGSFNEFIWRMPLDVLFGLFSFFGMGLNISDKFLIFWPLAITTVLAPYLLVKEITQRRVAALSAALFYATNTYFLAINSQGHQLLPLAFNILTLAFTLFIRAMRSGRTPSFIWTALLLFVAGFIDFRVCYVGVFLLGAYTLAFWPRHKDRAFKKVIRKNIMLFFVITAGMQLYWILAFGLNINSGSEVLARSLFGNSFWDLGSVVTLHHPFWNGTTTTWFLSNNIPLFFWIIPVLALWGLLLKPRSKYLVFFAVTAIVGILLGKQVSEPFRDLYTFLFNHFPGFSAFREATKFYYLTLLGYSVLLGYLIMRLYDARPKQAVRRYGKHAVIGVFAVLCLVNAWPYISGSIGRLSTPRSIPADYAALEKQLSSPENDTYSRTLWVPASSRWSYYTQQHPRVNATSLLSTTLDNPGDKRDVPTQKDILGLLGSTTFQHYLSLTSIKYVIVPLRDIENQNDFFSFYGDSRQPYVDALNSLPFLKRTSSPYKELAVYENQNYQPYATAAARLYNMQDPADFAGSYPFLSTVLQDGLYSFEDNPNLPKTNVRDVFSRLRAEDYRAPAIPVAAPVVQDFFFNANKQFYSYEIYRGSLDIYKKQANIENTGTDTLSLATNKPVQIADIPIKENKTYYIKDQNGLAAIDTKQPTRDFGSLEGEVSVYASENTNLLPNGSFEQDSWEKQVRDCDPYDADARIGMNITSVERTEGSKSLNLWALRHTACTRSPEIAVTPGTYLLRFDYKAPYADQISYKITMDGKGTPAVFRPVANNTGGWITHTELVTIPAGVTKSSIELRGLPPGSFSPLARFTSFDNVTFMPLEVIPVTDKDSARPNYQKVHTVAKDTTLSVVARDKPEATNLISNPSLEDGLWQDKPGDCNNYDGEPQIAMNQSNTASNGKYSLELRARRHIACTGPETITVKEGKTYLLRFDYQGVDTKTARYSINFNDLGKSSRSENLKATSAWQTYQRVIKAPLGASELNLRVHAVSDETGRVEAISRYDNFSLIEVPDVLGQLFAVDELAAGIAAPKTVTTRHISSSKKEFEVQEAKDPFYLSMAETYHAGWQLDTIPNSQHFKAAGFMNGWHVDPTTFCTERPSDCTKNANDTYTMRLTARFTPQKWLALGTVLSILVLVGSFALLLSRRKETMPAATPPAHRQPPRKIRNLKTRK